MVSVVLSIDEHIICLWPIHQGIGPQCHPSSLGRYPVTSWVQRGHIGICTFWGGCWMLWGVMLPLWGAYQRRPCCCLPLRTWWLLWGHELSPWGLVLCGSHGWLPYLSWVEAYSQLSICLLGVHQAADPWCRFSLFGDDSLLDHLC